jgi:signal transduction histidine kinase
LKSLLYKVILLFLLIKPIYSSEPVFKINDLDIINELNSANAGKWELTDQQLDIDSYYKSWLNGDKDIISWKEYYVPGNLSESYTTPFSKGFSAIIKKEFMLPENLSSHQISLFIRKLSDRDKTYINGYLIGSTGNFDSESPQALLHSRIYDIPGYILKKGEKNLLIIVVQNYFDDQAGILSNDIKLGPSYIIYQSFQEREGIKFFIGFIYFLIGSIFFFIYLFHTEKTEYMFYALFNIFFSMQQISISQAFYDYISFKNIIWHIPYLFLPPVFCFFTHFVRLYFKTSYSILQKILDLVLLILFIGILIFNDMKVDIFIWKYLHVPISFIFMGISISIIYRNFSKKNPDARYMLFAFILLLPAIILDYLSNFGILIISQMISPIFLLSFDVSLAIILSLHIEKIRTDIKELNIHLEEKVNQRTKDLKDSLEQISNLKINEDNLHYFISIKLKKSVDEIKELSQLLLQLEFIESEERSMVLNKIYFESDDLFLTLQKLISWTILQNGESYGTVSHFLISDLTTNYLNIYMDLANRKGITLSLEIEELSITTNKDKLLFILRELISNSIKNTNQGGEIKLKISSNEGKLNISLIDSGIGIEKNEFEKILKISDSSLTYKVDDIESNFPLGLKICRMYIESLDGKFQMESTPNQGTNLNFSISLQ